MQLIDVPMIRQHWQRLHQTNNDHTHMSLQHQTMPIRHVISQSSHVDTAAVDSLIDNSQSQYEERLKRIDNIYNSERSETQKTISNVQECKENEPRNAKTVATFTDDVQENSPRESSDPAPVETATIDTDDDLLLWKARVANLEAAHQQKLQLKRQIRERATQLQQRKAAETDRRDEQVIAHMTNQPQHRNICVQSDEQVNDDNTQVRGDREEVAVQTDVDSAPPSFTHPIKPRVAVRHLPMKARPQFQTASQKADESVQTQLSRMEVERQRGFELEARANALAQIGVIGSRTSALAIIEPALLLNAEQIRQKYEARVAAEAEQKRTLMALINGIQTHDTNKANGTRSSRQNDAFSVRYYNNNNNNNNRRSRHRMIQNRMKSIESRLCRSTHPTIVRRCLRRRVNRCVQSDHSRCN